MDRYDIVVFGASGFTGQYVVEELVRNTLVQKDSPVSTWAVAGRSESKLRQCLQMASNRTGADVRNAPVILADVSDYSSLKAMTRQATVLLNCVGPYRMYGEAVVRACLETKSHHLDISGEPGFLDGMQVKYDKEAREAGVYILGSCGFDTVPNDLGVIYTRDQAKGDVNVVESFLSIKTSPGKGGFNFGTWQSAIYCTSNFLQDMKIHRKLLSQHVPKPSHKKKRRLPLFYNSEIGNWCMMLPSCDEPVVRRTQHFNYHLRRERPVQFNAFFRAPNILVVMALLFIGTINAILAQFAAGRYLMEEYPWILSGGLFHKTGPSREKVKEGSFSIEMVGQTYSNKLRNPDVPHTDEPTGRIVTRVSGPELAYITTPICLLQCAYVLMSERDKMPECGGVMTPGMAFAKTKLIERLHRHGVQYEVISQN